MKVVGGGYQDGGSQRGRPWFRRKLYLGLQGKCSDGGHTGAVMKFLLVATFLVSATLVSAASVGSLELPVPAAEGVVGLCLISLSLIRRSRA